jgi:thymidine phosphorylase
MRAEIEFLESAHEGIRVDLDRLVEIKFSPVQLGAFVTSLWHHTHYYDHPLLKAELAELGFWFDSTKILRGHDGDIWWSVIATLLQRCRPAPAALDQCLARLEAETPPQTLLCGVFLALCLHGYFGQADIPSLTEAFIRSGRVYDYRKDLGGFRLTRRYPTGGLSEKCALVLPAMFECFGDELRIKSPFSVGRTLGFTGGTWDKLSSIEGFHFPSPGEETLRILRRGNCAITVTLEDAAPADRVMYRRRSQTSTVECDSLIVSSIASKHAAIPVHSMILDVRIGRGAFIPDWSAAERIGGLIRSALAPQEMEVLVSIKKNVEPNGSSIGNYLEVVEALEIIRNIHSGLFDLRGKHEQLSICIDFFVKMVALERPEIDSQSLIEKIEAAILSGRLWSSERQFLSNHGVPDSVLDALEHEPLKPILSLKSVNIRSAHAGSLRDIDQRKLGSFVYNELHARQSESRFSGVILNKRRFDPVRARDALCTAYASDLSAIQDSVLENELFAIS